MKKWNRNYIVGLMIYSLFIFLVFITITVTKAQIPLNIFALLKVIFWLQFFFFLIAILILLLVNGISIIRSGMHNMKECDDKLFNEIDEYRKYWKESNVYYIKRIQIINYYYKDSKKVSELVKNQELERLFARLDYIDAHINLYDHIMTLFHSLVLSILASIMCTAIEGERIFSILSGLLLFFVAFLVVIYLRYSKRGEDESYDFMLFSYEKKLLLEKIEELEESLRIGEEDEEILRTKQKVINELLQRRKQKIRKKIKEQIVNDIECVENLNLCLENYSSGCKKEISIMGEKGYVIYDTKSKKEEYDTFYKILEKYSMFENRKERNGENEMKKWKVFWLLEKEKILMHYVWIMYAVMFVDDIICDFRNIQMESYFVIRLGVVLGLPFFISILLTILDFLRKKEYIKGLCFSIIEACQKKEQYKRFLAVKDCLLYHKEEGQAEIDISTNIYVVEAAIALDKTYNVILPIFITVMFTVLEHDLLSLYALPVEWLLDIMVIIILLQYIKILPRNAFIKKVVEAVKKEKGLD